MEFDVIISDSAESHLLWFKAREQQIIKSGVRKLITQPTTLSKALKRLRANPVAEYELRVREYRVLYNVDEARKVVDVLVIGRKRGNALVVEGKVFDAHKSNPHG